MFSSILLQIVKSIGIIENIGMKWVKSKKETFEDHANLTINQQIVILLKKRKGVTERPLTSFSSLTFPKEEFFPQKFLTFCFKPFAITAKFQEYT